MSKVVYVDFDGTIVKRELFFYFLLFINRKRLLLFLHKLLYIGFCYLCRICSREGAKRKLIFHLLHDVKLDKMVSTKLNSIIDKSINNTVYDKVVQHIANHDIVIIVSANLDLFIRPWALKNGFFDVIATKIGNKSDYLTGHIVEGDCFGINKVKRILNYLKDNNIKYNYSIAYGNSVGDYEMLDYVDEAYWVDGESITSWGNYKETL